MNNTLPMKKSIQPWKWIPFILVLPFMFGWALTDTNFLWYLRAFSLTSVLPPLFPVSFYNYFSILSVLMVVSFCIAAFCALMRWRIAATVISILNVLPYLLFTLLTVILGSGVPIVFELAYFAAYAAIHLALIILCFAEKRWLRISAFFLFTLIGLLCIAGTVYLSFYQYNPRDGLVYAGSRFWQYTLIRKRQDLAELGGPMARNALTHLFCLPPLSSCMNYIRSGRIPGSFFFPVSIGMYCITAATVYLAMPRMKPVKIKAQPAQVVTGVPYMPPQPYTAAPVAPAPQSRKDPNLVAALQQLLDAGVITQDEYNLRVSQLPDLP